MTNDERLQVLNLVKGYFHDAAVTEALDSAIAAIEKVDELEKENYQLRIDAKAMARINTGTKPRWEDDGWICPNCGEDLEWETDDGWHKRAECCCYNCGQVIDWTDKDSDDDD